MIDTHVHIWNFAKANYDWLNGNTTILNRTHELAELETERIHVGVTEGVLVQAANNFEDTNWMLENATKNDWIKGVVGWLPLMQPEQTYTTLQEKFLHEKYFKGVRHLIHDEPDAKWLLQPAVMESLEILAEYNIPYDIVGVLPAHIETALAVAAKIPNLKMVFDHLNQPPIQTKEQFGVWGTLMKEAAQYKNFYVKISGLGTTSGNFKNWSANDIKPYVAYVIEQFGVDRCFCGGDWPVSLLAGSYTQSWTTYKTVLEQLLNKEEQEKIVNTNAKQFYKL